jgi:hypothetical protein
MAESASRLRAGIAGATITPDRPLPIEGYAHPKGPAVGTRDPLEARAIVFDDGERRAAVVSVDLISLWPATVRRIRTAVAERCGIPADNVLLACSHTHSGPAATRYTGVRVDDDYLRWLESTVVAAVAEAAGKLRPATLGAGEGSCDFNMNRRTRALDGFAGGRLNPLGAVDRRVRVLRVDPADAPAAPGTLAGRALPQVDPIALLFGYVCHPTVLGPDNYRYSSDYPGSARRFVESVYRVESAGTGPAAWHESTPGDATDRHRTLAMFLPGCFGNVRPKLLAAGGRWRPGTDHELTALGRWLGSEVVQVAERSPGRPVESIAAGRREVRLAYARVADEAEIQAALETPRRYWAEFLLERIAREGTLPAFETTEVQVIRLGRHWLVATPGETVLEIGQSIERGFVELGLADPSQGDQVITIGYANDYVAYLCSASLMIEGGYEAVSWYEYLRSGPFVPEIEATLVNAALGLGLELAGAQARTSSADRSQSPPATAHVDD